eukprot:9051106-Alexandrium_andersonii.AAC.1
MDFHGFMVSRAPVLAGAAIHGFSWIFIAFHCFFMVSWIFMGPGAGGRWDSWNFRIPALAGVADHGYCASGLVH